MKITTMEVTLIDHMGDDLSVVNAARVSFAKESEWEDFLSYLPDGREIADFRLKDQDVKLINYLAKHNHWTPFAHCFVSFHIKVPMFVAMQLDKHTVGLVTNSVSRRYVDDEPEFWFPKEWRGRPVNAKQGSNGVVQIKKTGHMGFGVGPEENTEFALVVYNGLLEQGVAPEQARMVLPMNTMTERIWSGSLAAFSRVCKLRLDDHAQQETREVVGYIRNYMVELFPVSFNALMEN